MTRKVKGRPVKKKSLRTRKHTRAKARAQKRQEEKLRLARAERIANGWETPEMALQRAEEKLARKQANRARKAAEREYRVKEREFRDTTRAERHSTLTERLKSWMEGLRLRRQREHADKMYKGVEERKKEREEQNAGEAV